MENVLKTLPNESGVYIYKDANDTVIYVGKARNLKNRVRSYFHSNDLNLKTRTLVSNIANINYIVTANELEALLLENNLIKKYKPKYNILLKDDKGYPYLKINTKESFPKLELARKLEFDGAQYFGPYHGAGSAKTIADIALDVFPLKTCNYDFTKQKNIRPCLKYHINRCPAPCVLPDRVKYKENVDGIISFLKGNQKDVLNVIRAKMESAAEKLEFELAAELRDKLKKADEILNKQKIVLDKNENIDVISVMLRDTYAVVCSLYVRAGRLIGANTIELQDVTYDNESQILSKYIIQHYSEGQFLPKEIVCDVMPEDSKIIEELISEANRKSFKIHLAKRGKKFELCLMAKRNAREKLEKSALSASYKEERIINGLEQLKAQLDLKKFPERIECFDISHIQGTDTVASMVVFTNGKPDKKEYRRFKTHQGNNDYASMQEVVSRRYNDFISKKKGFDKFPDLIVIDGGKGQLSSAIEIIKDKFNFEVSIIGLAEKLEEIYLPNSPVPLILDRANPALQILQAIRDEAHRFAITFHRSLRGKHSLTSTLDNIPSIGAKRKKELLRKFSTVSKIKEATLEELESIDGMNKTSAQAVYNYFKTLT